MTNPEVTPGADIGNSIPAIPVGEAKSGETYASDERELLANVPLTPDGAYYFRGEPGATVGIGRGLLMAYRQSVADRDRVDNWMVGNANDIHAQRIAIMALSDGNVPGIGIETLPDRATVSAETSSRINTYIAGWEKLILTSLIKPDQPERLQEFHTQLLADIGVAPLQPKPTKLLRLQKEPYIDMANREPIAKRIQIRASLSKTEGVDEFIRDTARMRMRTEADVVEAAIVGTAGILVNLQAVRNHPAALSVVAEQTDRLINDKAIQYIDDMDERLIQTARLVRKYEGMVPAPLRERYEETLGQIDMALRLRSGISASTWKMLDTAETTVINIPANFEKMRAFYRAEWNPPAEIPAPAKQVAAADPEKLVAERKRLAAEKVAADVALQAEQIRHDEPIRETLQGLTDSHDQLLSIFRDSNKSLRAQHIIGASSLEYRLGQRNDLPPHTDSELKTYSGLLTLAGRYGGAFTTEFMKLLDAEDRLNNSHEATKTQLRGNGVGRFHLDRSFRADLAWLSANWDSFKAAVTASAHKPDAQSLILLGQLMHELAGHTPEPAVEELPVEPMPELVTTETDIPDIADEPAEIQVELTPEPVLAEALEPTTRQAEHVLAALERANREAERLDWIPIPPSVSDGDGTFVKAIRDEMTEKGIGEVLEEQRIEDLLMFKELYGGTLYRAAERVLSDSKRLYFVLTFTHQGHEYAIAENPFTKHATYVIREDLIPLSEGETVLSAAKLDRKYLQDFGIKQHIHDPRSAISHADKINGYIEALAMEENIRLKYRPSRQAHRR